MLVEAPTEFRALKLETVDCDLVVVGGGMAGICCAITAAREGLHVALVQDRPVLGGNASSEVRLWMLGATSHMGNNNRWAREEGVIGEIIIENMFRNPEGNPLILDSILLEKVVKEPNIRLLLNTVAFETTKLDPDTIASVRAFCSQNSTMYTLHAPLFCDASGDGIIGFLSGAAFRMGAESESEFGEKLAPSEEYGHLLGHSLYFYSKDVGRPVTFVPPSFALNDITQIPRFRSFNAKDDGCRLWWIEYGGRLDTVHDTETIKWELWKIVYGVWNFIKNSGKFPEAENLTLEWIGHIPGKRESRRFEGDYMLRQQDIVEQRHHEDAVSHGGWALDLHPADGIYSEKPGCDQWHSRGVYQIPYRCLYSRNIRNLFLAGRIFSATHVAFGSTRVQLTLASAAQAVGMAAVLCQQEGLQPADISRAPHIQRLQQAILNRGQYIPGIPLHDPADLVHQAQISASSFMRLQALPDNGPLLRLDYSWAQMLPVPQAMPMPAVSLIVDVERSTTLTVQLRTSDQPDNHTPDVILAEQEFDLNAGTQQTIHFVPAVNIDTARYVFVCLLKNADVQVHTSEARLSGVISVANAENPAVSNYGRQDPKHDIGVEAFEFWSPQRRPGGRNFAFSLTQPLMAFEPENIRNGWHRPTNTVNAWAADSLDQHPTLSLRWNSPQNIMSIVLHFDTDFDHPMESVLKGHPERSMPFCVKHYRILDDTGRVLHEETANYQTRNIVQLEKSVLVSSIHLECLETQGGLPPAIFGVQCYNA